MNGYPYLHFRLQPNVPEGNHPPEGPAAAYTDATLAGHLAARSIALPGASLYWVHLLLHQPAPLHIQLPGPIQVFCIGIRGTVLTAPFRIKAHYAVWQQLQSCSTTEIPAGEYEYCCIAFPEKRDINMTEVALSAAARTILGNIRRAGWTAGGIPAITTMVQQLLGETDQEATKPAGIRATLQHIRENYADPISVKRLARMAGLNVNAYTIRFREVTGQTPSAFIQQIRVEAGRDMLWQERLTMDEISARSGFTSRHYFSRVFRRHYGMSPAAFRRDKKNNEKMHLNN